MHKVSSVLGTMKARTEDCADGTVCMPGEDLAQLSSASVKGSEAGLKD